MINTILFIRVHTLPYYKKIGYQEADLSNAENYYSRCLSLPMYPTLSNDEQDIVIELIQNFFKEN